MRHFNLLGTFAIIAALTFGAPALAQQLHAPTPGVVTQHIALADDVNNPIAPLAQAEEANFTAFQQTPNDGRVVVPVGDWIAQLLSAFALAIGAVVSALAVKVFGGAIQADRLRQYTQSAVNYAINLVDGAVQGKSLTVPVANQVLERALEYSVDMFPALVSRFGGTDTQRQRIVAALNVEGSLAPPARTMSAPVAPPPPPATPS